MIEDVRLYFGSAVVTLFVRGC